MEDNQPPSNPKTTDKTQSPPKPHPSTAEEFMHKNRLQTYAQRSAIPLPSYLTANEGSLHTPKFRSTVFVDGVSYESADTFATKKEAEQFIAKFAFESILKKIKDEPCPLIHEDTTVCKSILNEFAVKVNAEKPTYTTTQCEGPIPIFTSTLVFDGKSYSGDISKNKKEAERLAARAAIQSILGTEFRQKLSEIIKSKSKLFAAMHQVRNDNKLRVIQCSEDNAQVRKAPEPHPNAPQLKKPKLEQECATATSAALVENKLVLDQSPNNAHMEQTGSQSQTAITIGRKYPRKKNKKKTKKMLVDGRMVVSMNPPMIQAPSCSLAQ